MDSQQPNPAQGKTWAYYNEPQPSGRLGLTTTKSSPGEGLDSHQPNPARGKRGVISSKSCPWEDIQNSNPARGRLGPVVKNKIQPSIAVQALLRRTPGIDLPLHCKRDLPLQCSDLPLHCKRVSVICPCVICPCVICPCTASVMCPCTASV